MMDTGPVLEAAMIHFHLARLLTRVSSLAAALFLAADSPTTEEQPFSALKEVTLLMEEAVPVATHRFCQHRRRIIVVLSWTFSPA
jgi:hypothetical protein